MQEEASTEKHCERDIGRRTDNPHGSESKTGNTAKQERRALCSDKDRLPARKEQV